MHIPKSFRTLLLVGFYSGALALRGQIMTRGTIRGTVKDQSGAVIPAASVQLAGGRGRTSSRTTTANGDGDFRFEDLPAGDYLLRASAPQLVLPQPVAVSVTSAKPIVEVTLQLQVRLANQEISVDERPANAVGTDAASNASAVVIRGQDLDALADNPEDLAADLAALAGPSAGPNGGAIFIDGFSGGQLPSKDAIREIRINQNPFSPEYDKLGFGRIEIFTKPGSDKFKGALYYNFGDDSINTRNPYASQKAPFRLYEYGANISGPLGKRASLFVDTRRDSIDNGAIINGSYVDPVSLAIIAPYSATLRIPQRRTSLSPRLDYQFNQSNTLTARYTYLQQDIQDSGVGSFNLPERGVHAENASHNLQLTETAVLGARAVNETRLQFIHFTGSNTANTPAPALQVLGAFNGGGSTLVNSSDGSKSFELQNNTTVSIKAHSHRFGVRVRGETLDTFSPLNFNGTFTFGGTPGLTSIERYRQTLVLLRQGLNSEQIHALGFGPTQFSINSGTPGLSANQYDFGAFYGDDWRMRSNLTMSYGIRFEKQTNLHDWTNVAPRFGLAWAPGGTGGGKKTPKTVIRAGFGMFYDRFNLNNTVNALRYNGIQQRQFVISDPLFYPVIPDLSKLSAVRQTIQSVSPGLKAPLLAQTAIALERQLPRNTSVAITFANAHGARILRSRVLNPGEASSPNLLRFQMQSSARYNQNQLITSFNTRVSKRISLNGSYVLNRARSDSDGVTTFPANPSTLDGEYGPAATDIRHRFTSAGTITAPLGIRLNPLLTVESGPPFDITVGRDLYGSTLFNGRPALVTDASRPGVIATAYGFLDPNPAPGSNLIGRNYGRGPGQVMMNLRLSRTFQFGFGSGQEAPTNIPGGGERRADGGGVFTGGGGSAGGSPARTNKRYSIVLSLSVRNLLNHTNPGPIIGNLASPLFGQANQPAGTPALGGTIFSEAANNRRLELQTRFTF
jgi:hypothetical protein